MRKPLWLRAVGWVDLALWLWCVFVLYEAFTKGPLAILFFGIYLFLSVAFALFCLWAIVSGIVWSANKNARVQAAVTRDVVKRMAAERGVQVELPTARTGIVCARCGSYAAVLHCSRHNESLCWRCAVVADSPDCAYILAYRVGSQQHRQKVPTSPLSGIA